MKIQHILQNIKPIFQNAKISLLRYFFTVRVEPDLSVMDSQTNSIWQHGGLPNFKLLLFVIVHIKRLF